MQTSWALRSESSDTSPELLSQLAESLKVSPLTVELLFGRGLRSAEDIRKFLFPDLDFLLDSFLLPGIPEAVKLIRRHLACSNRILIHGDYDVDGVTASAILVRAFRKLGIDVLTFLPHRVRDGYGLTRSGVDFAKEKQAKLLITVDCGISAAREIAEARTFGIDVIVTDHHQIPLAGLPPASAIIHPLIDDAGLPFKDLSAAGLAYKLSQALLGEESYELLDLAALGTVADLAPLAGENRVFVKFGLEKLREGRNLGLKALTHTAKARGKFTTMHLGFIFGPRINASGRVDTAENALQLLISHSERETASLARILEEENKLRQRLEREAVKQAIQKVEREINFNRDRVIVVWDKSWHPGVIGIVASRLVERFYRPSVVISLSGETGKGSARSIRHFNIFKALNQTASFLLEHGGHEQAAGLKIEAKNLEAFRQALNDAAFAMMDPSILVKSYDVDLEMPLSEITHRFIDELNLMEPFGLGNPKPLFLTRNLSLKSKPIASGKESLKFWLTDEFTTLEAVWYRPRSFPWDSAERVDVIYTLDLRNWQGETFPILEVKDLKPSS